VTSVVKNNTGRYTVNFTNSMDHANYTVVSDFARNLNSNSLISSNHSMQLSSHSFTNNSFNSNIWADGSLYFDVDKINFTVF
jgi:adhesin HecA-like repeat protein